MTNSKQNIKVAVTLKEESANPYLGELYLNQSQTTFTKTVCDFYKIENADEYGIQYVDAPAHYMSDQNRDRIIDGVLLLLVSSVARLSDKIVKTLINGNAHEKAEALETLSKHSNDPLVAKEFIKLMGVKYLVSGIEEDRFEPKLLIDALQSYVEIMEHEIIPWHSQQQLFIKKIVSFISDKSQCEFEILHSSLSILESSVTNSQEHFELIENMITLPHLLHHINHISNTKLDVLKQIDVYQSVLALVNALFLKAERSKKKYYFSTLTSRQYRSIFMNNIFKLTDKGMGNELLHQLYVLEQQLLNQYEERALTPIDLQDQKCLDSISELQSVAFEDHSREVSKDVSIRRMEFKKELKKLGFKDDVNPANDFLETPPGLLSLDNICYFAKNHSSQYSKLVLENCYRADSHECPFGRASIELTKLMCRLLKVGEAPLEDGKVFHRIMFKHDHVFEELFSTCIVLFNKTWKEMKATTEDFSKVVRVLDVQISRTLNELVDTLESFSDSINKLSYSTVAKIWQEELNKHEEIEMQAPPIVELTKQIKAECSELVQQHFLGFLVDGTRFQTKAKMKEKKFQYWRLSPNHKFFHFGNCSDSSTPSIEQLRDKISVVDIKDIVTGKDCPNKKDRKCAHTFSMLLEDNRSHDFDAPDEKTYIYWLDGINALLRRKMTSDRSKKDLDLLVNMELKLRLLDTEGVHIPQQPPPIPPLPANFDFTYQSV